LHKNTYHNLNETVKCKWAVIKGVYKAHILESDSLNLRYVQYNDFVVRLVNYISTLRLRHFIILQHEFFSLVCIAVSLLFDIASGLFPHLCQFKICGLTAFETDEAAVKQVPAEVKLSLCLTN
jgi:hypothetical protein